MVKLEIGLEAVLHWCWVVCCTRGLNLMFGIAMHMQLLRCCLSQNLSFILLSLVFAVIDIYCTNDLFTWLNLEKNAAY